MDYGGTLGFNLGVEDPNSEVGNSRVKNKISQKKIIIIIIVSLGKERNRHSKNKRRIRGENSFYDLLILR
jgi:hypothetical protein